LTNHTILVGYGRVGSLVGEALRAANAPFLVIEDADKALARLRADNIEVIAGNAAKGDVLLAANPEMARTIVLAIPDAFEAGQVIQQAKAANSAIMVIARAHSDAEVEHLSSLGADDVIMGEREIARGIVDHLREDGVLP
jgi:CPA2 family monovalent cation:H+ antiporter-2